ncbi:MAG: non-homologous end-joining DNA ligase [Phycisphaerae bacterium]|nr:non-homologous end-joining DNA ligase [Phycisphaerae bacterium]
MRVGRRSIEISNADKVLFPDAGLTKGDLIEYYQKIGRTILRYAEGRALVMHRYPNGVEGKSFYQKKTPHYFPDWIERADIRLQKGGRQEFVVVSNVATLAYLAGQACITPHIWLSYANNVHNPDLMVFDLDPTTSDFAQVRKAGIAVRDMLEELGVTSFVQLTGSRGLHVVVPLDGTSDFGEVRDCASELARLVAQRHQKELTVEQRKNKRGNRVFVDYLRNAFGQTIAAPYAVRAKPQASVATPLDWDELENGEMGPRDYTTANIFRRLGSRSDPWKKIRRHRIGLKRFRKKLADFADK